MLVGLPGPTAAAALRSAPVKQLGSLQAEEEEVSVAVLIQQIVGSVICVQACDMRAEQGNSERFCQPIVDAEVRSDHFLSISTCPA